MGSPRTSLRLPSSPEAARIARGAVRRTMAREVEAEPLDALLLCVSELVTNAVEHGAPPVVLRVGDADEGILLEVLDGGGGSPQKQDPGPGSPRGRGLLLVDGLASRWGIDQDRHTTRVWATFA
jgi:serine/threonine-protein kinase RsbW